MRQLRLSCAAFFGWLFILYNIERLHKPINLASFVYVVAAGVALPLLAVPRLQRLPWQGVMLIPMPVVLLLKAWLGYPIGGTHLPITVTELCAVAVTGLLAHHIGRNFEEFRQAAVSTLVSSLYERAKPLETGQSDMYRELRRARAFQRPVTVLTLSPSASDVHVALDRFTHQVQLEIVSDYMRARLAGLLAAATRDCDIITHDGESFVILLAETSQEEAAALAETLKQTAKKQLGLALRMGMSTFPDEEVTFTGLLAHARANMQRKDVTHIQAGPAKARTNGHAVTRAAAPSE